MKILAVRVMAMVNLKNIIVVNGRPAQDVGAGVVNQPTIATTRKKRKNVNATLDALSFDCYS